MNVPILPAEVNRVARPVPLYEHVKRQISEAILIGALAEGTILPSEATLAAQFGVAIGTIRHALADLTAEGLLSRRRRTGTVVTGRAPHHSLRFFFHYFRLHATDGGLLLSETEVTSLKRGRATGEEAQALALDAAAPVIRLDRIRRIENAPIMLDSMVLPAARMPDFPTSGADVPSLLYLHLAEQYGLRISAIRESLTADLATAPERRALNLPRPASVLRIASVAYDQSGQPVLMTQQTATTANHIYVNEVR